MFIFQSIYLSIYSINSSIYLDLYNHLSIYLSNLSNFYLLIFFYTAPMDDSSLFGSIGEISTCPVLSCPLPPNCLSNPTRLCLWGDWKGLDTSVYRSYGWFMLMRRMGRTQYICIKSFFFGWCWPCWACAKETHLALDLCSAHAFGLVGFG